MCVAYPLDNIYSIPQKTRGAKRTGNKRRKAGFRKVSGAKVTGKKSCQFFFYVISIGKNGAFIHKIIMILGLIQGLKMGVYQSKIRI